MDGFIPEAIREGLKLGGEGLKSGIYGMQEINRGVSQFRS